ncbi:hypothetical protein ABCR94_31880 [Streptomyces sp. 21So2-11]|uniref:hypothetical protein n=1 Tax=Streptomyces sp. 21So2-11 TaxID=3144408 RepID=UPI0032196691
MRLQLAGGLKGALTVIDSTVDNCRSQHAADMVKDLQAAIRNDSKWLIQGYGLIVAAVFGFGVLYLYRPLSRRFALRGLIATPVLMVVDHAENVCLLLALDRLGKQPDVFFTLASCFALVKWPVAVLLGGAAMWVAFTLLARRLLGWMGMMAKVRDEDGDFTNGRRRVRFAHWVDKKPGPVASAADIIAPSASPHPATPLADWSAPQASEQQKADSALSRWRTRAMPLPGREAAAVGICVSGGGIRSASVTLGALQALREGGVLQQARYLVSVSGGGYTAGAFQLAITDQVPPHLAESTTRPANLATPADAFAPGSPEEDHIRRHAKYLADRPGEVVRAVGTVLRGVLVSLGLLTLLFIVMGQFLQALYGLFPTVIDLRSLRPDFGPDLPRSPVPGLRLHQHVTIPVVALLALAASVSVIDAVRRVVTGVARRAWLRNVLKSVVWLAVAVTAYAVLIPTLLWLMAWLTHDRMVIPKSGEGVSALGTIAAGLTWLGALFAAGFRRDEKVKPDGGKPGLFTKNSDKILKAVGTGWVVRIVVWLVLLVLAFVYLFILFWVTVSAHSWDWRLELGLVGALALLAVLLDQTAFSLHPFYRQRLAGAFAVRRAVLKDGSVGSLPYDYNCELTKLSTHAKRVAGFPQVIFSASAALSGRNRTAPGRPAVPFTFASDYIGGPDVGWVKTATMEQTAHPLIRRDLSVQSAMAVSGAAFASAMGTKTSAVQRLFTLSNLRLGTWVPNPAYLAEVARKGPLWTTPRLPRVRRLRYQLQELLGRYSDTSPMLLCTDGGHFDNLGLVELLRLRCRTIYVIDSAGDSPPLATTLAQAVTLAYEDLGVEITFNQQEALRLVPGSADRLAPEDPMAVLNARLSADSVLLGSILYPDAVDFGDGDGLTREGTIIVAKAGLTPDVPYELLSYALQEKAFPRQATTDQWFDHAQFDAYRALGHHLGTRAAAAAAE